MISESIDDKDKDTEEFNVPVHLGGGTTKFKVNHVDNFLAQMFADIVVVGILLVM